MFISGGFPASESVSLLRIYNRIHQQILTISLVSHGGFRGLHSASGPFGCDAPEGDRSGGHSRSWTHRWEPRGGEEGGFTTCTVIRGMNAVRQADGGAGRPRDELCGASVTAALGREPSKGRQALGHVCCVPSLIYSLRQTWEVGNSIFISI